MAFMKKTDEIQKKLEKAAIEAVCVLSDIARNEQEKAPNRIRAANLILDRCYGKPPQAVDFSTNQLDAATLDRLLAETSRAVMIDTGRQKIAIGAKKANKVVTINQ